MHGFWVSTEVFIDDVDGYLWGEGKKIWSSLSDDEKWDCFDWICDNITLEDETGDIDEFIVRWNEQERDNREDDADEGRCRKESRRMRFRRLETKRKCVRRVNEAYTSFSRWENDVLKAASRIEWKIASTRDVNRVGCVWNGDLYANVYDNGHKYTVGFSPSPEGREINFYIFKDWGLPAHEVILSETVPKADLLKTLEMAKGKISDGMYRDIEKILGYYRFK